MRSRWMRLIGSAAAAAVTTGLVLSAPAHAAEAAPPGDLWAWGDNTDGALGGATTDFTSADPLPIPGMSGVTAVAAGVDFGLALMSDGTVRSWGDNTFGQLGDGTNLDHTPPAPVLGLTGVVAISAGTWHSVAVTSDGSVWAWGDNSAGQLGLPGGSGSSSTIPVQVPRVADVVAVDAGAYFTLAATARGKVWAWGSNTTGELGDGTVGDFRYQPKKIAGLTKVVDVAAGLGHSVVATAERQVWAWGENYFGQVGIGVEDGEHQTTPQLVPDLTGVRRVAAGAGHTLAVTYGGAVWAWGDNADGQLGDGTQTTRYSPVPVPDLTKVATMDAGGFHSLAVQRDGTAWAWGQHVYGQLGVGPESGNLSSPAEVPVPGDVTAISGGDSHTLAVVAD